MNLIMISSNHWNSQCFLKRIDIAWCHNYHSQFLLCSFVVKAILPLPVVLDIYCRALQLQTEHIHIQTIVNLQTMIDHCPRNFKNQWLDPQLKSIVAWKRRKTLFWKIIFGFDYILQIFEKLFQKNIGNIFVLAN